MKHASEGIHSGFETQGKCHQKSKTGVSMAPQKGLVSYKKIFKKIKKKNKLLKSSTLDHVWSYEKVWLK